MVYHGEIKQPKLRFAKIYLVYVNGVEMEECRSMEAFAISYLETNNVTSFNKEPVQPKQEMKYSERTPEEIEAEKQEKWRQEYERNNRVDSTGVNAGGTN